MIYRATRNFLSRHKERGIYKLLTLLNEKVPKKDIARELGVDPASVSRYSKKIIRTVYILEDDAQVAVDDFHREQNKPLEDMRTQYEQVRKKAVIIPFRSPDAPVHPA